MSCPVLLYQKVYDTILALGHFKYPNSMVSYISESESGGMN